MSGTGRFPKSQSGGKGAASKESTKKTDKSSAGRKPSMERGPSSRSGTSSLPSSPMNPKPAPIVSKKTSPMPGKKDASLKLKGMKAEVEKTSGKIVEEELQGAVGGVADGEEHRSRSPPASNKTNKVETGVFRKPSPVKFQPVTTRPVLSPRSKKVQESAKKFLNLKKTENNEQKGMEEFILKQFPILRNKLDFVEVLSGKVSKLPISTPESEELIRQENASLNRFIFQAGRALREFENMLLDTRGRVVEYMTRAEDAQRQLDDSLRTFVNDICNYSNPDFLPTDQQGPGNDPGQGPSGYKGGDQGKGPSGDQGGDKAGDQERGGPSGDQGGDKAGDQEKGGPSGDQGGDKSVDLGNEGGDDGPGGSAKEEKSVDGSEYHIKKSTAPFPGINLIDKPYISPLGLEDEYEWESEYEGYPRFRRIDNFFKESMRDVCVLLGGFKDTVEDANTLNSDEASKKLLDVYRTVMTVLHGLRDILQLHNDTGEIRSYGQFVDLMKDQKLPDKDSMEMKTRNLLGDVIVQIRDLMESPDFPDGHKQSSYEGVRHLEKKARQCLKDGVAAIIHDYELD